MTYEWLIEPGDTVAVYFNHTSNGPQLEGVVKSMPQATGDAWIIVDSRGESHYVNTYASIARLAKGTLDVRFLAVG